MQAAVSTYAHMRNQQCMNAKDACRDAAEFHGVPVGALARELIACGIDAARLALLA